MVLAYFASNFRPSHRSHDGQSTKRRRIDSSISDDNSNDSRNKAHLSFPKLGPSAIEPLASRSSSASFLATVRQESEAQYQRTGQNFRTSSPGLSFPNAPPYKTTKSAASVGTQCVIEDELPMMKPPLIRSKVAALRDLPIKSTASWYGLRRKHVDNMTAVLHKCVLNGDYVRAGRAWGMLLRMQQNGHGTDIRRQDQWGLGAEMLLKCDMSTTKETHEGETLGLTKDLQVKEPIKSQVVWYSRDGFESAKKFYERLILQYPHRKAFPTAKSALEFYPAMFGLWLYAIQEHIIAVDSDTRIARYSVMDGWTESGILLADSRETTLQGANEIASRLDELMVSPPYSDDYRLWRLRGMVALWIADLWNIPSPSQIDERFNDEITASLTGPRTIETRSGHPGDSPNRGHRMVKRQAAMVKAEQAFAKAKERDLNIGGATI